jgi:hypothetical protein
LGDGVDGVFGFEVDRGSGGGVDGEEAFEADALVGGSFEVLGEVTGAVAEADDHDEAESSEFAADESNEAAGGEAEDEDEGEGEGGEEEEEGAGEVKAEEIFGEDEGDGGIAGLAEEVAEDDATLAGAEFFVDAEPVASEDPGEKGQTEDEGFFIGSEGEVVAEVG